MNPCGCPDGQEQALPLPHDIEKILFNLVRRATANVPRNPPREFGVSNVAAEPTPMRVWPPIFAPDRAVGFTRLLAALLLC